MVSKVQFQVHPKENLYFTIKLVVSLMAYAALGIGLAASMTINIAILFGVIFYVSILALLILFQFGILIGYLKNNAVKVTEKQFPDIYNTVLKQAQMLELESVPDVYLLQQGGILNAFATRFLGTDYIVIYSDILEEAYENNKETVDFVIAHELGHVKRKHLIKRFLLLPGSLVPFLGFAYSRACEYTCDNIGAAVSPKGAVSGLLVLASGKKLYKRVNVNEFVLQSEMEGGFWSWFAEKISTHPKLTKRVALQSIKAAQYEASSFKITKRENTYATYAPDAPAAKEDAQAPAAETTSTADHSRFMPGA